MTKEAKLQNIVRVKTALADKYERLSRVCRSAPSKARLLRRAERYRHQAANAEKGLA